VVTTHHVVGDRIIETITEAEVVWRGNATPYAFGDNLGNPVDYMVAWNNHLPQIQQMGLNTIRLTFRFPDSTIGTGRGGDDLEYAKLDKVLAFLSTHNIKGILDCHNYADMATDFGSQKLIDDWVALANHCKGYESVVAYELFNEPGYWEWDRTWMTSKNDVVTAYRQLTNAVRAVDPEHIVIWESSNYLPDLLTIKDLLLPNTVFTLHRWWSFKKEEINIWGPEKLSYMTIGYPVDYRKRLNVPFWFGEFGTHGVYDETNPEWVLTHEHLKRCQEQLMGWNLWYGGYYKNPWTYYLPFFPLPSYSKRQPWVFPVPSLFDYIVESNVDLLEPYVIEMWHTNDYVTLKPGIVVNVKKSQLQCDKQITKPWDRTECTNAGGTMKSVLVEDKTVSVKEQTTIKNEEETTTYPGDWNTRIYPIGYNNNFPTLSMLIFLLGAGIVYSVLR